MAIGQHQIKNLYLVDTGAAATSGRPNEVAYIYTLDAHFYYTTTSAAYDGINTIPGVNNGTWHRVGGDLVKSNLNPSLDPTPTDDSSKNYTPGSLWVNTLLDKTFVCVDSTVNFAVWHQIDGATPVNDQSISGYVDIGNMRIQWGSDNGGAATRTITFPVAFANTSFVFVATPKSGSAATTTGNIAFTESGGSRSITQVVGEVIYTGGAVAARAGEILEWIAIGRK